MHISAIIGIAWALMWVMITAAVAKWAFTFLFL